MKGPLIAIVGDARPNRLFTPAMKDPAKAKRAAEELGTELAQRGARLLVYGGPFLEADVVRGFVAGTHPWQLAQSSGNRNRHLLAAMPWSPKNP